MSAKAGAERQWPGTSTASQPLSSKASSCQVRRRSSSATAARHVPAELHHGAREGTGRTAISIRPVAIAGTAATGPAIGWPA